ncbi:glycoside hydrolase family 132 protein [Patellaria atrata CBS 101060]|uniref:Glycoside hydrolase family 132 protein n=1 Tax=Patellaria atrata CBS 101060 TaxID=1346257 RepID=A0A9P4VIN0_9PEZI|nr:glycoside hydrolase family 132 protein [Patellaria atrata CBS 101060]
MRIAIATSLVFATAGLAAGHRHQHHHAHEKRIPAPNVEVPRADTPTVTVYELGGRLISEAECAEGIKNGTLIFADGGDLEPVSSSPTPSPEVHNNQYKPSSVPERSTSAAPSSSPEPEHTPEPEPEPEPSPKPRPHSDSGHYGSSGVDRDFPDGELDCDTFPSEYGAVPLTYLGLKGWTGIQLPRVSNSRGYDNIFSPTSGGCSEDGSYCSYACPPGYQKSQWPELQGATGQSVGGIKCRGGKLWLTNPGMSKRLCMKGTTAIDVKVQNDLGDQACVCRTDYPGDESETVPLATFPGNSYPLTCPEADNYYNWQGKQTSAQYYVNNEGIPQEKACRWGSASEPVGNFAPLNLGVGYSSGTAWLSIFQNYPTTNAKLDFSIEIIGNDGGYDNLSGRCKYSNGKYCSGENYNICNSREGCTVAVTSGEVTFKFSHD